MKIIRKTRSGSLASSEGARELRRGQVPLAQQGHRQGVEDHPDSQVDLGVRTWPRASPHPFLILETAAQAQKRGSQDLPAAEQHSLSPSISQRRSSGMGLTAAKQVRLQGI